MAEFELRPVGPFHVHHQGFVKLEFFRFYFGFPFRVDGGPFSRLLKILLEAHFRPFRRVGGRNELIDRRRLHFLGRGGRCAGGSQGSATDLHHDSIAALAQHALASCRLEHLQLQINLVLLTLFAAVGTKWIAGSVRVEAFRVEPVLPFGLFTTLQEYA